MTRAEGTDEAYNRYGHPQLRARPPDHKSTDGTGRELRLDTPAGCAEALGMLTRDLDELAHGWASAERELKVVEEELVGREAVAVLAAEGETATELKAKARAALDADEETAKLIEQRAELRGELEAKRRIYAVKDRQSSNVQSLLGYHRDEWQRVSVPRD